MRQPLVFLPLALPIGGMLVYFLPSAARVPVFLALIGTAAAVALVTKQRKG